MSVEIYEATVERVKFSTNEVEESRYYEGTSREEMSSQMNPFIYECMADGRGARVSILEVLSGWTTKHTFVP